MRSYPVSKLFNRNSMFHQFRMAFLCVLALIIVAGCTKFIPMSPKIGELVLLKPIPVEVALLVTDETRNYVYRGRPSSLTGSAGTLEFPLGQALETVSMDAFSQVFRKVVVVRTLSDAQRYPAHIKPSVEAFDFRIEPFNSSPFLVKLTMRVALMDANAQVWERVEANQTRALRSGDLARLWGEAATENLVTSMKKIAMVMSEDPVIRRLGAPY
jgi:hypothetical protein